MKSRLYKAFTLIEMLIVMGIIMILIGVGVAGTRYALSNANRVKHENAVDTISQTLVTYYSDHRKYPTFTSFAEMLASSGDLGVYLDSSFDGGADATYYYWVSSTNSSYLVCVSLGGISDENKEGFYCNGNGFGDGEDYLGITEKNVENVGGETSPGGYTFSVVADWVDDTNSWE